LVTIAHTLLLRTYCLSLLMMLTLSQGVSESQAFTGLEDTPSFSGAGNGSETKSGVEVLLSPPGADMIVQVFANADQLTGADPANTTAADRRKRAQKAQNRLLTRLPITPGSSGQCRLVTQISAPIEVKTNHSHVSSIPIQGLWVLKCTSPQKLKHVDIGLFAMFPALESVSVIILSEKTMATKPIQLKRSQTRVTF